jgi:hypothetical protein
MSTNPEFTDAQLVDAQRRVLGALDDELLARVADLVNPLISTEPKPDATEEETETFHAIREFQRAVRAAHTASMRALSRLPVPLAD